MTNLLEQVAQVTDGGRRFDTIGSVFYKVFMHLAREPLLAMDACPAATPSRTLVWFVSARDANAARNVKLALAALKAESRGWGLRLVHTPQAKAVADSVERALPARCRSRLESVSLASMGINLPRIRRGQLSCLQASKIYFEGTHDTVVIAGGEDVVVRRPILDEELSYAMLGAPWKWCRAPKHKNPDECRFGGNGGFAVRDPAFVAEHGIQARPKVDGFKTWARECGTMHHNDDIYLAIKMNELYVNGTLGRFRPAPHEVLMRFAAETIESNDPVALHKTWKYLSAEYTVRQFRKPFLLIRASLGNARDANRKLAQEQTKRDEQDTTLALTMHGTPIANLAQEQTKRGK
jgi:hypothetical protein